MEQGWLTIDNLRLVDEQEITCWNGYLAILKASYVKLSNDVDMLVWNQSKSGKYSPKASYLQLIVDKNEVEISWWWKMLWKFKCPLKSKMFCRFLFSGKALTWDVLCRKGREGPGRCYLCKMDVESNFHIGVGFPFTRRVSYEIESKLKINNLWHGSLVIIYMKNWCLNVEVRHIRSLPVIVSWFIWKSRNQCCFDDFTSWPYRVSSFFLGLLSSYPQDNRIMNIRIVVEEIIDKSSPWVYFEPQICGAGGLLYISDEHYFTFTVGLGLGTNNLAKLLALNILLTLALEHEIHSL